MVKLVRKKFSNLRIVIPNLTQYKDATLQELSQLKYLILQRLRHHPKRNPKSKSFKSEFERGLQYYCISLERHANGIPHLDILLIYQKSIQRQFTDYDYLLKHGDLTFYRKLNEAILDYGTKEDLEPLSNLPKETEQVIDFQLFKKDPYRYLELKMDQDPLGFNVEQYVKINDLAQHISNWSSVKNKLKDMQVAAANLLLKNKPGFKLINRSLIESRLTPHEVSLYDSWSGYQTIVNYLNVMLLERGNRQQKSKNLLLTGRPDTGKSALVWQRHSRPDRCAISQFCSVYPIGMSQWFPKYQSDVYHCIYWNEAKLTSYSYDTILKLLDGSPLDLPNKGSVSRKIDNPLIIMTSNMTLEDMIQQKFHYNSHYIEMARANLASRVQNVIIPQGYDLFLLQKLLVPVNV
jgi:hypothetical protein